MIFIRQKCGGTEFGLSVPEFFKSRLRLSLKMRAGFFYFFYLTRLGGSDTLQYIVGKSGEICHIVPILSESRSIRWTPKTGWRSRLRSASGSKAPRE